MHNDFLDIKAPRPASIWKKLYSVPVLHHLSLLGQRAHSVVVLPARGGRVAPICLVHAAKDRLLNLIVRHSTTG